MSNLSIALIFALDLGETFAEHDPRLHQAAPALSDRVSKATIDAVVDALWVLIEHPKTKPAEMLEAWSVIRSLKQAGKYLL